MIKPSFVTDKFYPISFLDSNLYIQKGNKIGILDKDFNFQFMYDCPEKSLTELILQNFSITRRVLRKGSHRIAKIKNTFFLVFNSDIYYYDDNIKEFIKMGIPFKGSRPLNFNSSNEEIIFGEYFSNKKRSQPVKLFKIKGFNEFNLIHKFKKGDVRHIHNCLYDSHDCGWWILTGDSDSESRIYFLDNSGIKKILGGSQKYRCVEIIADDKLLIIPSDTPQEVNYIRTLNKSTLKIISNHKVSGSVFHAKKVESLYLVSTVTEPSTVNKTKKAFVYASTDGINWKEIFQINKDFFPVSIQKITRYTEIRLLGFLFNNNIVFEVRAAHGISHGTIMLNYNDVIKDIV